MIYGSRLIGIGAAYKAKMLCSEVFVANRPPQDVLAELGIDDLKALNILKTSIVEDQKLTSASFLGLLTRTARYRDESGCALLFGSESGSFMDNPVPNISRQTPRDSKAFQLAEPATNANKQLVGILDEAFAEPDPEYLRRTRAVVIVHKGRIIAERYATGTDGDMLFPGWSMTKSVLNALVGILVRDGRLSVDAPVLIHDWQKPGDERMTITLNQLLHMTSGLQFNEDMSNPLGDVTRMLLAEPDMAAFTAKKALETEPGTQWRYSSGNSIILSKAIRNMMDPEEYRRFPHQALFEPLGMSSAVLETDADGTFVASSFMYATARDWARFGMLYLDVNDRSRNHILPEGWIEYTKTAANTTTGKSYGAHFWLKLPDEYNRTQTVLPEDTFHAVGHEGQFVTIVPSYDTVIVRLGKTRYAQAWDQGAFAASVLSRLESE